MKCKVTYRGSHRLPGNLMEYGVTPLGSDQQITAYAQYPKSKDDVIPLGSELFIRELPLLFTSEYDAPPEPTIRLADVEVTDESEQTVDDPQ